MLKIRVFEEKVADLILKKEIICPCHLYIGQEAVATGVCAALRKDDYIFSTHRSHGHYLAKGGDMKKLMAELFCRETGTSKGRGGSMHIASIDMGIMGSSAIVGGSIPLAVGAALGFKIQKKDSVAVAFFGEGAVCEGVFYESLNFAALKKLPVIFVCEKNHYSTHMPISKILADPSIYKKALSFAMDGALVDGNDVLKVYEKTKIAVDSARSGEGPYLLECLTYRWRGHVGPNYDLDKGLRSSEELEYWMKKCPIKSLEKIMVMNSILSEKEMEFIKLKVENEVEEAIKFAKESPKPPQTEDELMLYVFK
ncbi:MAG: thiamine pyrophosphate-dependent dehydrogenase E1 component subunit alpha [Candidatus Methanomethyliaceae archaeon]|nr:thiamine pyrophosphate-dependent dehydrogenase E1 component subunit alpha [Candidatus Methanomethyliaceae archaeon]